MAKQWIAALATGALATSLSAGISHAEGEKDDKAPPAAPPVKLKKVTDPPATERGKKVEGKGDAGAATCASCFTVRVLADATVTSDSIQAAEAKSSAAASFGIAASRKIGNGVLSLEAALARGSAGSDILDAAASDYFAFLRSPKSALGGELRGDFQWKVIRPWLYLGPQVGLRAAAATFELGGEVPISQHLAVVGVDVTCASTLVLDDVQGIELHLDAGLSSRFWNKPKNEFVERLGIKDDAHAFFGPRAAVYFTVKNAVIGIELSRYWGGNLERFKEFTILPYVGVSLGGTLATEDSEEDKPKDSSATGLPPEPEEQPRSRSPVSR